MKRRVAIVLDVVIDRACALTNHAGTCFIMNKWVNTRLYRSIWWQ